MKEIDCCLVRHFEENLRLRNETGWAEFGYSKMDAPRVSRVVTSYMVIIMYPVIMNPSTLLTFFT